MNLTKFIFIGFQLVKQISQEYGHKYCDMGL